MLKALGIAIGMLLLMAVALGCWKLAGFFMSKADRWNLSPAEQLGKRIGLTFALMFLTPIAIASCANMFGSSKVMSVHTTSSK
jgi:hypothetical protein